eukprot:CAMPEP_0114577940 /NCGR_PEP_ID=MMETSP0125-20121206/2551_1 /TAXON_ID=485358 ORGANISM="Aristerostoma sp., Strain ATCC 50986" /NCGR_SAMPLE_ID=MMETSP0125 /ASSEMBLY_ACC=CAM_ASM_000245 /LENGTH=35 /DNA_ID= /DNA_START= /DNA_END= /DNA_ORIENTATION=
MKRAGADLEETLKKNEQINETLLGMMGMKKVNTSP